MIDPWGSERKDRIDDPTLEQRKGAIASTFFGYKDKWTHFRLGGPHTEGLRELLTLCRKENLPARLVLSPEGKVFQSWYPPGVWEEISTYLRSLCSEFGAPLIDAHNWMREEEFMDSHHLLPTAAKRYTDQLGREGILPVLAALKLVKNGATAAEGMPPRRPGLMAQPVRH